MNRNLRGQSRTTELVQFVEAADKAGETSSELRRWLLTIGYSVKRTFSAGLAGTTIVQSMRRRCSHLPSQTAGTG